MNNTRPQIVTHRGGDGPHPENTPEAYEYAAKSGCEAVEMDVRFNYLRRRFFLAHDLIHHPRLRRNYLEIAVEKVPKNVKLVLEFKTISLFPGIIARAFQRFYEEHLEDREILAISFNPTILIALRKNAPNVPRGFLCGSLFTMCLHNWFLWRLVSAQWYIVNKRLLSNRFVLWVRQRGMLTGTYIVNSLKAWERAAKYDVDAVITDHPKKLMELRSKL